MYIYICIIQSGQKFPTQMMTTGFLTVSIKKKLDEGTSFFSTRSRQPIFQPQEANK